LEMQTWALLGKLWKYAHIHVLSLKKTAVVMSSKFEKVIILVAICMVVHLIYFVFLKLDLSPELYQSITRTEININEIDSWKLSQLSQVKGYLILELVIIVIYSIYRVGMKRQQ